MIPVWFTCVVLSGYFPCKVIIDSNLRDTLVYGWSLCSHESFDYVNYDNLVVENDDTKNDWLSYRACLAYVANIIIIIIIIINQLNLANNLFKND
jgi:hypothetical protein